MKKNTLSKKLRSRIKADPMAVADLYSTPEDGDICEPLVRALEARNKHVRKAAVKALICLDDLYAASEIYWVLLHGSIHARMAATEVLSVIGSGDPLATRHLAQAMKDLDCTVRSAAAVAFIRNIRSSPECFQLGLDLLASLQHDEEEYVRDTASEAFKLFTAYPGGKHSY